MNGEHPEYRKHITKAALGVVTDNYLGSIQRSSTAAEFVRVVLSDELSSEDLVVGLTNITTMLLALLESVGESPDDVLARLGSGIDKILDR